MGIISIFCTHTIPTEHPNGVRMTNIGQIFAALGYEVHLYGYDKQENLCFKYKSINCHVWENKRATGEMSKFQFEMRKLENIEEALRENPPRMIVSTMYNCKAQQYLLAYAKKYKLPIIQSVCEWFDRSEFPGIRGLLKFLNNRYSLQVQYPAEGNIIAISELLEHYYKDRGCNTVILPTIVDMDEYTAVATRAKAYDKVIRIAYAGSPAKKDYIANAIRAVALLDDDERKRIQLHFFGPKTEQLSVLGITQEFLEKYKENVICHGRIPYEQVKTKIAEADFTVLLRPNKRYANAGFPTKVGESMACGTPVIANLTSDLGKYIINGQTGIVCADETPESCADAFRQALSLSEEQRTAMREQAYQMACTSFCYDHYLKEFEHFLENCYAE